jgi:site-specific recombinase XerD
MTIRKAEQYCLFSVRVDDEAELEENSKALMEAFKSAPNTAKAYGYCWKIFTSWCRDRQYERLPACPKIVRHFLYWMSQEEEREPRVYKRQTIELSLSAIRHYHRGAGYPMPVDDDVRELMRTIRRKAALADERPENAGKRNLRVEQLSKLCASMGKEPIDIRDRAIVLVGFASALRRSDLALITIDRLHFEPAVVKVWVPRSKTDQLGKGRYVFLYRSADPALCPIRALEEWRKLRTEYCGNFRGPLFTRFAWNQRTIRTEPLSGRSICLVLQRRLERCGIDPRDYGAHSLRSGYITAANEHGASIRSIMDQSGHASLEVFMRYIKSKPGANPLAGVL